MYDKEIVISNTKRIELQFLVCKEIHDCIQAKLGKLNMTLLHKQTRTYTIFINVSDNVKYIC